MKLGILMLQELLKIALSLVLQPYLSCWETESLTAVMEEEELHPGNELQDMPPISNPEETTITPMVIMMIFLLLN